MKIKESNQFIPLKNTQDRADSKEPLEFNWRKKTSYDWISVATHPNIGLRLDNLLSIDFNNISDKEEQIIIEEAKKYKCIFILTGEDRDNSKKGIHLLFNFNEKSKNKIPQGENIPLFFGLSANIKYSYKNQIVIRLQNFDGDRLEASYDLNKDNNYSLDELDYLPPIFKPIAKSQPEILNWKLEKNSWEKYINYLTIGGSFETITEKKTLQYCNELKARFNIKDNSFKDLIFNKFKKAKLLGWFEEEDKLFWRKTNGALIPERLVDSSIVMLNIKRYHQRLYLKINNLFLTEEDNGRIRTKLYEMDSKLNANDVDNVIKKLLYYAPEGILHFNWKYNIYTPTRVINVRENSIRKIEEDEFFIHAFKYEYNKNAKSDIVDKFLDEISLQRAGVKKDIIQALAVGIIPESFRKLFMFYGLGSNGKGTLFEMFKNLFATNSINHISLEKIIQDQFMPASLSDMLANISDELSIKYFPEFGTIKSLISNNEIHGRRMFQVGSSFKPHVTLYLQGNDLPMTREKTDAINNRMVFIPMDLQLDDANNSGAINLFNEKFFEKEAQEYLFKLLVDRVRYNISINKLEFSQESINLYRTFTVSNDPTSEWIESQGINYFLNDNLNTQLIHEAYLMSAGAKAISIKSFNKKVKTHFGLKTKQNGWKDENGNYTKTIFILDKKIEQNEDFNI